MTHIWGKISLKAPRDERFQRDIRIWSTSWLSIPLIIAVVSLEVAYRVSFGWYKCSPTVDIMYDLQACNLNMRWWEKSYLGVMVKLQDAGGWTEILSVSFALLGHEGRIIFLARQKVPMAYRVFHVVVESTSYWNLVMETSPLGFKDFLPSQGDVEPPPYRHLAFGSLHGKTPAKLQLM